MTAFVKIHSEGDVLYDTEFDVQVRATVDTNVVLDSLKNDQIETEFYVVFMQDVEQFEPNYQIGINTQLSDLGRPKPHWSHCNQCGEGEEIISCTVWFSDGSRDDKHSLCKECAEKFINKKNQIISQIPDSELAKHSL